MSQRFCLLVMGTHRSGTSALARTLGLMGAAEANRLLPPDSANPSGYWESELIVQAHDRFLRSVGSRWDNPRPLPSEVFAGDEARACVARLATILETEFGGRRLFVVKDPRLCRVSPLIRRALHGAGVRPLVIIPLRPPSATVQSLQARSGFSRMRCVAIWLGDMLAAERLTRGVARWWVSYDDFRHNPFAGSRDLAARLGCFPPGSPDASARAIREYWAKAEARPELPPLAGDPLSLLAEAAYVALGSEQRDAAALDSASERFARLLETAAYRHASFGDGLKRLSRWGVRILRKVTGFRRVNSGSGPSAAES